MHANNGIVVAGLEENVEILLVAGCTDISHKHLYIISLPIGFLVYFHSVALFHIIVLNHPLYGLQIMTLSYPMILASPGIW